MPVELPIVRTNLSLSTNDNSGPQSTAISTAAPSAATTTENSSSRSTNPAFITSSDHSLTLGLAIGIPLGIILFALAGFLFWMFSKERQRRMMVEQTMQEFLRNQESKLLIAPYAQEPKPYQRPIQELAPRGSLRLAELPPDGHDIGNAGQLHWSPHLGE